MRKAETHVKSEWTESVTHVGARCLLLFSCFPHPFQSGQEPPTAVEAAETALGQHEPLDFYLDCKQRLGENPIEILK